MYLVALSFLHLYRTYSGTDWLPRTTWRQDFTNAPLSLPCATKVGSIGWFELEADMVFCQLFFQLWFHSGKSLLSSKPQHLDYWACYVLNLSLPPPALSMTCTAWHQECCHWTPWQWSSMWYFFCSREVTNGICFGFFGQCSALCLTYGGP